MHYKKQILLFGLASVLLIGVGYANTFPEKVGLCAPRDRSCIFSYPVFTVGNPLLEASPILLLVAIILYFRSEQAFRAWRSFAVWYIPLGALLVGILVSHDLTGDPLPDFTPGFKTLLIAVPFLIISLVIAFKKQHA